MNGIIYNFHLTTLISEENVLKSSEEYIVTKNISQMHLERRQHIKYRGFSLTKDI